MPFQKKINNSYESKKRIGSLDFHPFLQKEERIKKK